MHDETFDRVVRAGVQDVPRRRFLGLVAGLAGATLARPTAEAGRKRRKKCKAPRVKCGKKCLPAGACCTNAECGVVIGQVCVANRCECPGGQVVTGNTCAQPCTPVCGECQRCDTGVCIDLADDTPCSNGGTCQAGLCKADRSFGCPANLNTCTSGPSAICPNSATSQAACFIDGAGDSVCGTGLCTNETTDAACVTLLGAGAFVLPCSLCSLGGKTRVCVKPVAE